MNTASFVMVISFLVLAVGATQVRAAEDAALTPDSIHIQRCSACHYQDGKSPGPEFPKIAGQYESYLMKALKLFKENKRESDAMQLLASLHQQQELVILASYFAKQKPDETPSVAAPDHSLKARGEQLFFSERVYGIACANCHGHDARGYVRGSPRTKVTRAIPRLAGQREAYLRTVMEQYRVGKISQGMCAMRKAAKTLGPQDVDALVEYLASR